MQKLIQGSHYSTNKKCSSSSSNKRYGSSSTISAVSLDDDTTIGSLDSTLLFQQIGISTASIPVLEFDKFVEEVRRPLTALVAGTATINEANEQLRYYLVQKFTEN